MNWTLIYILNIIGIVVYFNNRFTGRKKKAEPFNLVFWLKDNRQELVNTIFLNIGILIIARLLYTSGKLEESLSKLPEWIQIIGLPGLSFAFGLGLTHVVYSWYLNKVKAIKSEGDGKP